ncbi:recombinase family protein [Chloroflexota bacterium]
MKLALYSRVSSGKQDINLSISAQLNAMRRFAQEHKDQAIAEFTDEAKTGRTSLRPSFLKMIEMACRADKPFDAILVYKFSRFARSRRDSILLKARLLKKGVKVISVTERVDDSSFGMATEGFIELMDEFYAFNLGEEVTRGMRESASRGFYLSAKPPYGYKKIKVQDGNKERTKLDIIPFQAKIVEAMFNDILYGKGLIDIARDLNSRAIPGPHQKGWNKTGLYHILHNEIYVGTWVWGRNSKRSLEPIRVENAFPAIINYDEFNRVQIMLKERTPAKIHPRRTASRFLLSGLARCSYCGKALIGRDAKSGKFSYYVCGTLEKRGAGACPSKYMNSQKFEGLVIDRIKEYILTEKQLSKLVYLVNEQIDVASKEFHEELKIISREEDGIAGRLNKLYDAVETGNISLNDLAPRIRDLRSRQEKLLARRSELEIAMSDRKVELADMKLVKSYINDLRNTLDDGLLTDRRAFIRSFIKEIIVSKQEVKLIYTIPLLPDGLKEECVGVLPIVRYGGRYWI